MRVQIVWVSKVKFKIKLEIRPYFFFSDPIFFKCPLDLDHSQGKALLSWEPQVVAPLTYYID